MREEKTHSFHDPKTIQDLRAIVKATEGLDGKTGIRVEKVAGDQREPGYTVIHVEERRP